MAIIEGIWNEVAPDLSGFADLATFTQNGAPFNLTGYAWQYVVRQYATDTGTPLIELTTTATANGQIVVNAAAGTVQVNVYGAAMAALEPTGEYVHSLWINPDDPVTRQCVASGTLSVGPVAKPV